MIVDDYFSVGNALFYCYASFAESQKKVITAAIENIVVGYEARESAE